MSRLLWICLGGAVGTAGRYLLGDWLLRVAGPAFPWGTLAVNLLGSFLLGVIMQIALTTNWISPTLRLTLGIGVMGGFTTYSSFNYETLRLFQGGAWLFAAVNLTATVVGCLLAGVLGLSLGRLLGGG
ncbi:MAG: fluoride efflux transporter CrcB [Acidobacteriota bacterium]